MEEARLKHYAYTFCNNLKLPYYGMSKVKRLR